MEIPKVDCKIRGVYKLDSRNLTAGVWDGSVFIGIRYKFNSSRLSGEFHWDDGAPHGTAKALEYLGQLPDEIELKTTIPIVWEGQPGNQVYRPLYEYLEKIK